MPQKSWVDAVAKWASIIVGIGGLAFAYGMASVQYSTFPYYQIIDAKKAAAALYADFQFQYGAATEQEMYKRFPNLWFPTNRKQSGVITNIEAKRAPGYTFFSDHTSNAYLIDSDGNIIQQWHKLFYDIWPEPTHILEPTPEELIYIRAARPLPDGSLIAVYEGINQSPYGGGIAKLDKDSNVVWSIAMNMHHDFDIDAEGNIYVLSHKFEPKPVARINDYLTIVSPDGEVLRSHSFLEGFRNSQFFNWLENEPESDFLHTNAIEILTPEMADAFPYFSAGDILVSYRTGSALSVLDGETFIPKWLFTGVARANHDPDFLANGHILFLDNDESRDRNEVVTGAWRKKRYNSRLLEIDPASMQVVWSYEDSPGVPFYTKNRGSLQKLSNDNILVTESTGGRIFEITMEGELVWEYVTPALINNSIAVLNWAQRYTAEELPFIKFL